MIWQDCRHRSYDCPCCLRSVVGMADYSIKKTAEVGAPKRFPPRCRPAAGGAAYRPPVKGAGVGSARLLLGRVDELRRVAELGGRHIHRFGEGGLGIGLRIGRERDELLRTRTQLLAERRGEFHLLGYELGGGLRSQGGRGLCQAPLQVIAGNGVLVTAQAVNRLDAFLLSFQRGRECVAVGLEYGLGIKSRVAHVHLLYRLVNRLACASGSIIAQLVCSARGNYVTLLRRSEERRVGKEGR